MADYNVVVKLVDQTRAPLRNIESGLQSVQTRVEKVNKALDGIGSGLGRASQIAAAALSAAAVSAVRYADAVTDASEASNVSVATILALGQAITVSGGNAENAQAAVIKFADAVGSAAAGSEAGRKAFERAGISLKDLGTLSEEDLLKKTLEGLGGIANASSRASATTDIFGKTLKGVNISAFSGNIAKLRQEQEKNAAATKSAADLVDNLKLAFGRLQLNILNAIKPAADFINKLSPEQIDKIVNAVIQLGVGLIALSAALKVFSFLNTIAAAFNSLALAAVTYFTLVRGSLATLGYLSGALATAAASAGSLSRITAALGAGLGGIILKNLARLALGLVGLTGVASLVVGALYLINQAIDIAFDYNPIDVFVGHVKDAYEWMLKLVGLGDKPISLPGTSQAEMDNELQRLKNRAATMAAENAGRATPEPILEGFYDGIAKARKEYGLFKNLINSKDLVVASAAFDRLSAAAATLGKEIQKPAALIERDFNQSLAKSAEELRIANIEYSNTAGQITKFTQELEKSANQLSLNELRLGNNALMTEKFRQELQSAGIALTENQIKLDDAATQQNVYRNEVIASLQALQDQEQRLNNVKLQQRLYSTELQNGALALQDQSQRLADAALQQGLFDQSIQSTKNSAAQQTQTLTLLNAAYAAGKISTDEYADAVGGLNARLLGANQIMAQAQSAAAQEVKLTADRKIAVENLTAAYAANGGTGTKAFTAAATALGASKVQILTATTAYQSYADKIVEYNDMIKLSVENAAETFSDEFSKAFLKGENMLTSFKNFFGNIMNDIANNIIKKQLADPIAAAMNNIITGMMGSSGGGGGIGGILGGVFSGGLEQLSGPTGGGFFDSISSIFGFANGGLIGAGTTGLVGENGPEFITGPANITPMDQMGGTSAPNVTITINAIDTQTGVQFLLQNKPAIVSMVTDAYNRRGRSGPLD